MERSGDEREVRVESEDTGDQDSPLACMAGLEVQSGENVRDSEEFKQGSLPIGNHGLARSDPPEKR
jgi:hypothetical protein